MMRIPRAQRHATEVGMILGLSTSLPFYIYEGDSGWTSLFDIIMQEGKMYLLETIINSLDLFHSNINKRWGGISRAD